MSAFKSQNSSNFTDEIFRYVSYWPYYLLLIIISLLLSHFYLRYQVPMVGISSMIIIKDDNQGTDEKAAFKDLKLISGGTNNIEDEVEIVRSRSVIKKIISEKNLNFQYFIEGRTGFVKSEFYKNSPVSINCNEVKAPSFFEIKIINKNKFKWSDDQFVKTHTFSDQLKHNGNTIKISNTFFTSNYIGKTIQVNLTPINNLISSYIGRLKTKTSKRSNIVQIEFTDHLENRGLDFVNELVNQYNIRSINDKNEISNNTKEFIDRRLTLITEELGEVDLDVASFKQSNNIVDLVTNTGIDLNNSDQFDKVLNGIDTEITIVNEISKELKSYKNHQLIPEILPEGVSKTEVNKFNEIVLKRKALLETANENHPSVLQLDKNINELRAIINDNLITFQKGLSIKRNKILGQFNQSISRVSQFPNQEKAIRSIERKQNVKETLFYTSYKNEKKLNYP